MEFRILGPLEVVDGGRPVEIGGQKQRALLAVLLLHATEVVSSDALIYALWGERPPATAGRTLQAHVSRLRKALDTNGADSAGRVQTHAHGYLLQLGAGELDSHLVRTKLESARRALAEGDADVAALAVSEALALWRGAPLSDLAYESFAQVEIARLEELKLSAQEEWVEAELALGRHAAVVPELEALVRQNPLRERLLGQLMVALYRSGRQAEALHAYQEGRRALAEELGLAPSERLRVLERQILDHNPALAPPARERRPQLVPRPVWRHPKVFALLGAVVLVAAAAFVGVQLATDGGSSAVDVTGNAVVTLAARSGEPKDAVAAPVAPSALAVGYGYVWAASADAGLVVVLDPETNTVRESIAVESAPGGIATGGGWVWVTNSLTGTVSQISPETLSVVQTIPVGNGPTGIAAGAEYAWVANTSDHTVSKLRTSDGAHLGTFPAGSDPGALALGGGALWVASKLESVVLKLNPASGLILDTTPVGDGPAALAVGAGSVWVANSLSGTVSRIDPRTGDVRGTFEIGPSADAIAVALGDVWVASDLGGTVSRIDARNSDVTAIDVVATRPTSLATDRDRIFVGVRPSGATHVGGTMRVLTDDPAPPLIDTAKAYSPQAWRLLVLTNDGLLAFRRAGGQAGTELVPDLATSLPSVSRDGRTYTFQLRSGIRYSDGRRLRASDVRASIERLYKLKPAPEPAAMDYFSSIAGGDRCLRVPGGCDLSRGIVTDDRAGTVTFRLSRSDPEFLYKLALPFAHVLPAATPAREAVLRPLPATGPYRIATASRDGSLRLVRNPRFREWSSAAQPAGFPDEILVEPIANPPRRTRLVSRGRADFTSTPWTPPAGIAPANRAELHVQPLPGVVYLLLDTKRPPFDDVRARRAVNFAVDRDRVTQLEAGSNDPRPTCEVLPPNFPGYEPYCPYTLDPDAGSGWRAPDAVKAKSLLAESGTKGTPITLWWHTNFGARTGRYLERLLDSLGYRTKLRIFSGDIGKYFSAIDAPGAGWHVLGAAWSADYPAASNFINLLSCTSAYNWGRFCDRGIDARIRRALRLQEEDPASASESWAAIDRDLTDRAPWVSLYTPYAGDLVSKRVGNYQYHPLWGALLGQFWVR